MKITIVTDHFLPRIGGAEYASHCLATALTERGHRVTVLAPETNLGCPVTGYKVVRHINSRFISSNITRILAIKKNGKHNKPDIIHAQLLFPAGCGIFPYAQATNTPLIVSPQGADIHSYKPLSYGLLNNPRYEYKIQKFLSNLNAVTYSSRLMKKLLIDNGFQGRHFYYLPNGTSVSCFQHEKRQYFRNSFNFPENEIAIITISRHTPIKGLSLLIQALQRLPSDLPNWRAVIAGSHVEHLEGEICDAGLKNKIQLIPNLPFEYDRNGIPVIPSVAIANLLTASDIYAAPALSGGFELSSADAIAAGLPTVIFDQNGSKDIIEDSKSGLVVTTGDIDAFSHALSVLIRQHSLRAIMRSNALTSSVALDWKSIGQKTEQIYQSILTNQTQ